MMRGSTSFPNLFAAGDWIKTRHGSWGQVSYPFTSLCRPNYLMRGRVISTR
uniref:Uncharacterized protein LOC101305537 isoform X1 n=1 Tax=Rhizophora mucronata TaxID=61149 RepID=A0A2P2MG62_RHIMU